MNLSFAIYYTPIQTIPVKTRRQPAAVVNKIITQPTKYTMIDRIQNGVKCLACNK